MPPRRTHVPFRDLDTSIRIRCECMYVQSALRNMSERSERTPLSIAKDASSNTMPNDTNDSYVTKRINRTNPSSRNITKKMVLSWSLYYPSARSDSESCVEPTKLQPTLGSMQVGYFARGNGAREDHTSLVRYNRTTYPQ